MNSTTKPLKEVLKACNQHWAPPPNLTISTWADNFRQLSPEASAEIGQWRTSRVPYLKEVMDAIHVNQKVVLMASSQVAKTELLLNTIGYFMHLDPCPIMMLQPTIEMAQTISRDRIAPMLRDTPVLADIVPNKRARDSENTMLHKAFRGGSITLAGANSPASLASRPIRTLLIDECDRFPFSAGREGDPVSLATKRTATFWNKRIVIVSTPTIKGASKIEQEYELTDQRRYLIPCPHCDHYQELVWANVKWKTQEDDKKTIKEAWYECEECKGVIKDAHRPRFLEQGKWVATAKSPTPGFFIWQAYSPWSSFKEIAQDFLDAKDNKETLKVWTNTCLGQTFIEQGGESVPSQNLLARCEPYAPTTVPQVSILTAGVDVQKDRLAVSVWAWGDREEAWLVYHNELYGNPLEDKIWEQLDFLLNSDFILSSEKKITLKIAAAGIDANYCTQEVYHYVRTHAKVYAVRGVTSTPNKLLTRPNSVEVSAKGKTPRGSVKLWSINVNYAKETLFNRLRLEQVGAGYLHFPIGLDEDYFQQLTAEKRVTTYSRGIAKTEWVKMRPRNEALDCLVYAYAVANIIGVPRTNFTKLKAELLDTGEETTTTARLPRKNWVSKGVGV